MFLKNLFKPGMGHIPVIPTPRRQRQTDHWFQVSLGYIVRQLSQTKESKTNKKNKTIQH
jgi:hypothetical protein